MKALYTSLIFLFLLTTAQAQENSEPRFFLGVGATQLQFGGDFNGAAFVGGAGSLEILPNLEETRGIKFIAGIQGRSVSMMISFMRSKQNATWLGAEFPSTFSSYNLDAHIFIFNQLFIKPLVAFGIAYNTVTVEGGSSDGVSVDDATFKGFILRGGAGIEITLHEQIAIDLLAMFRYGSYHSVDGIVSGKIDDDIHSDGFTGSVEVKFLF